MTSPHFVHLRLHSEFSIVDGLVRVNDAVKAAEKDQQPALALTDLSNVFGLVKFYRSARNAGVKPIVGCDVWLTNDDQRDEPTRLLLLVKHHQGYLQLCELLSRAWLENRHRGRAEIRIEWLEAAANSDGLIVLSGAQQGAVGMAVEQGNFALAEELATRFAKIFPDHFYIEVQRFNQPGMVNHVEQSIALAGKLNIPVVATHPVQFISQEEFTAHEARTCISEGEKLANPQRTRQFNEEQNFKSQAEMAALFADFPAVLENTIEIAKRCNLFLELGKPQLPDFETPEGVSIAEFLVIEAKAGLENRLKQLYPDQEERTAQHAIYEERLLFETDTIINMGFPGYFLIVADFIRWAKNEGIPVGPGRGSGAGSLVAYSLDITDLDPLAYNLLFERFLNPERVSMPDFDIDFCQEGRDRVIQYVKDRYGAEAVAQIATFGTMAAKAAVRDVGRVLDLGYNFCDGVSKLIPFKPGKQVTIADARKEEPILADREDTEEEVKQLLSLAEQVEGITRNVGMHAGGVLIAPGKLTNFCPLYQSDDASGVVSQFDKGDVEAVGLVKFDFLGLTTLTILDWAVRYIRELDPEMKGFNLTSLPLKDDATYELLTQAKTVAVFQLESRGMQGMLKDARPNRFEDIIALVALYRPGPMDLIPDFCKRKHGEKFDYPDPRTEDILSETYGIMVYQEQVMQMAQVVGGYSLGGADLLRRAMGKKDEKEMAQHRQIFRDGAGKTGLDEKKADEIFDLMEKFAGYGFNKSHAAAYALLAYQTAYLKTHHPAAFMAANLSLAMDDTDKIKILVDDALNVCGLTLLPPDINLSNFRFTPVGEPPSLSNQAVTKIRYGLGAIRGAGEGAINEIIIARESAPFVDIFDFCKRVGKRVANRRMIESLIRAGAFDCFGIDRAVQLASVTLAIEAAEQAEAAANQVSLFGDDDGLHLESMEYVSVPEWTLKERLIQEKFALGFFLSGHLYEAYSQEARQFARTRISELTPAKDLKWLSGVISAVRIQNTQRGRIYIVTLDDGTGVVDITVRAELFETDKTIFKDDEFLMVQGKVSDDRFTGGIRVSTEAALSFSTARKTFGKALCLSLLHSIDIKLLQERLSAYLDERGVPVHIAYQNAQASCEITLGAAWHVAPEDDLLASLKSEFNLAQLYIQY